MKRIIQELIESRKAKQDSLKQTIQELGDLLGGQGFFNKNKIQVKNKFNELNQHLTDLITEQDKEWDAYSNNHSSMVFKSLQWKIEKLEAEYSHVRTLLTNFIQLEKTLQHLIDSAESKAKPGNVERLREIKDELSTYQYSDFETRFRGKEDTIKTKLSKYLPIFKGLNDIIDIGCGRGEFLELLQEKSIKARGIDISDSMLNTARAKGLDCTKADALQYLTSLETGSRGGIFSAQVIEHLEPEYLRKVVCESYRVLHSGAPLILETINPLSLFALSNIYFLDITHQKPVHPEYLRYLLESSGFSEVEIMYSEELGEERLEEISPDNPVARVFNTNVDKLNNILFASQVYAAKGIKK